MKRGDSPFVLLARIIHECCREMFEIEVRWGFSQVRPPRRTCSPSRRPNEKSPAGREDRTTELVFMNSLG
jgi:hypothetical protein